MKIVADTSSLIRLRKGGVIDCLGRLFDKVSIPQAVKNEGEGMDGYSQVQHKYQIPRLRNLG